MRVSKRSKHSQVRYQIRRGRVAELKERAEQAPVLFAAPQLPGGPHKNGVAKVNGGFADSAFADNKHRPIHRWVPWIAGFSSEFVRDAFSRYLSSKRSKPAVVLDPFCGVGTTLIEALRCGHDTVGFEINPYAALAARTKCEAATISPLQLNNH